MLALDLLPNVRLQFVALLDFQMSDCRCRSLISFWMSVRRSCLIATLRVPSCIWPRRTPAPICSRKLLHFCSEVGDWPFVLVVLALRADPADMPAPERANVDPHSFSGSAQANQIFSTPNFLPEYAQRVFGKAHFSTPCSATSAVCRRLLFAAQPSRSAMS